MQIVKGGCFFAEVREVCARRYSLDLAGMKSIQLRGALMKALTQEQVEFFQEKGYLHVPEVYSAEELEEMRGELDYVMETFANWEAAWRGPWRKEYMDEEEDQQATLVAIHELPNYSAAWTRAVTKRELGNAVGAVLETDTVELHHVTLHAKPPDKGAPFPMHQDLPFFPHEDNRYVDCL
ncbi:MAG: phytanoyl-CoA dioxygenase family protein, partial [bacterium]|nr:phytanoyl-CoA dioxygenase family protein [bacterium]